MADTDVKLRLIVEAVTKAGRQLEKTAEDLKKVSSAAINVGLRTKKAGTEGTTALKKFGEFVRRASKDLDKLNQIAGDFQAVGIRLVAIGAALAATVFFPVKSAAAFEKAMAEVKAVSEATEKQFAALADEAKRLGAETRFTATEAAQGLRFLALAGLSADESLVALEPTLALAAAGSLDVAEAADIATNVMSAMNLQVSDLSHVMDALAYTAANSNTNIQQMAEAMKFSAPIAAAAGIDINVLSGAIGRLGSNGIQATLAGTSLRGMIIALSAPTPKAQKALDKLGVTISKFADGSIDLVTTLRDLNKAQLGVAEATSIFRRTAAPAALALAKETEELEKLINGVEKADGAVKKMAKTMLENLVGAVIRLKSATEGLAIAIGEPLLRPFAKLLDIITSIVRFFKIAADEYSSLTTVIAISIGTFGALLVSLGSLSLAIGGIIRLYTSLTKLYKTLIELQIVQHFLSLTGAVNKTHTSIYTVTTTVQQSIPIWTKLTTAIGASKIAMFGLYAAATAGAIAIGLAVKEGISAATAYFEQKDAVKSLTEELKNLEQGKNIELKIMTDVKRLREAEMIAYRKDVVARLKYYGQLFVIAQRVGDAEGIKKYGAEVDKLTKHLREVSIYSQKAFGGLSRDIAAPTESVNIFVKTSTDGYNKLIAEVEKYAKKVIEWDQKIQFQRLDHADKIRELGRKGMTDAEAWVDRKIQAEEKLLAATEAAENKKFALAEKLYREAENLAIGLATEVSATTIEGQKALVDAIKETVPATGEVLTAINQIGDQSQASIKATLPVAKTLLEQIGQFGIEVSEAQRDIIQNSLKKGEDAITEYEKKLDKLARDREMGVIPTLKNLIAFQTELNKILEDQEINVTVKITKTEGTETTPQEYSKGGRVYKASGGMQLPGESKKDSVHVMARPGEWWINNEAVHFWEKFAGKNFMKGINAPWSSFGKKIRDNLLNAVPRFNLGGIVNKSFNPHIPIPAYANGGQVGSIKNFGSVNLNIGNNSYPVIGDIDVISKLKDALETASLVRSNE